MEHRKKTRDGSHHILIADHSGETRLEWRPGNEEEIGAAQKLFDEKRALGYLAYRTHRDGSMGELMHAFDPLAEVITLSPPMIGG